MSEAPAPATKPIDVATARRASLDFAPTAAIPRHQRELVNSLREKTAVDPDTALQMMAGRTVPDREVALLFADGQIGPDHYNLDGATGYKDRTSPTVGATAAEAHEVARATGMRARINEAYNYVENGTITPRAQTEVLRALYRDPGARQVLVDTYPAIDANFAAYMDGTTLLPTELQTAMNTILQNREYSGSFQDVVNEAIKTDAELANEVHPISSKIVDINTQVTEITNDLNAATPGTLANRLGTITTQLNDFDRSIVAGGLPAGLQARELVTLNGSISTAQGDVNRYTRELAMAQSALVDARNAPVYDPVTGRIVGRGDPAATSVASGLIFAAQTNLSTHEHTLADSTSRRDQIIAREQDLLQQQREMREQVATKRKDLSDRQKELREEQGKLAPLDRKRRQKELEFVEKVNGLFANATDKYMNARLQRVGGKYGEVASESMNREMTRLDDRLQEIQLDRWWRNKRVGVPGVTGRVLPRGWRRRTVPVIDAAAVDADYEDLLRTGRTRTVVDNLMGAEVRAIIRQRYGLGPAGTLTVAQQREASKMLEDLDKTHGASITDKLMTYKFRSGKVRKDEAERLQMTPLGLGFIERNWNESNKLKAEIDEIVGMENTPIDMLSRISKKKLAKIAGLIAVFLATGAVLAGGVSGSISIPSH